MVSTKPKQYLDFTGCGPPVGVMNNPYFMRFNDQNFTAKEEFYCWRYALHGRARLACREVYGRNKRRQGERGPSPKLLARVLHLQTLNHQNVIDLSRGPWQYYPWFRDLGYPDIGFGLMPRSYE